jgi:hypothetical protein
MIWEVYIVALVFVLSWISVYETAHWIVRMLRK